MFRVCGGTNLRNTPFINLFLNTKRDPQIIGGLFSSEPPNFAWRSEDINVLWPLTFDPVRQRETPPSLYKAFSGLLRPFFPLSARRRVPPLLSFSAARFLGSADAMGFGDLKSPAGLQVLNDYLADKSYIEGWGRARAGAGSLRPGHVARPLPPLGERQPGCEGPRPTCAFFPLTWFSQVFHLVHSVCESKPIGLRQRLPTWRSTKWQGFPG